MRIPVNRSDKFPAPLPISRKSPVFPPYRISKILFMDTIAVRYFSWEEQAMDGQVRYTTMASGLLQGALWTDEMRALVTLAMTECDDRRAWLLMQEEGYHVDLLMRNDSDLIVVPLSPDMQPPADPLHECLDRLRESQRWHRIITTKDPEESNHAG